MYMKGFTSVYFNCLFRGIGNTDIVWYEFVNAFWVFCCILLSTKSLSQNINPTLCLSYLFDILVDNKLINHEECVKMHTSTGKLTFFNFQFGSLEG